MGKVTPKVIWANPHLVGLFGPPDPYLLVEVRAFSARRPRYLRGWFAIDFGSTVPWPLGHTWDVDSQQASTA